ncbi:MAG: hypothetical protein NXI00_13105 [Cytophagales bacterium]|nr:hypothetical protein [Cytophagales bacterium]
MVSKHIIAKPVVNKLLIVDEVDVRGRISALLREASIFFRGVSRGHSRYRKRADE